MSENGEIYTAGNKFYTPAGTDGMDKFHLCVNDDNTTNFYQFDDDNGKRFNFIMMT